MSFAAARSRPRRGRPLRRFGCLSNNTAMRVSRPLTMPTRGRWQTVPAIARAEARNVNGGFCRKSGELRFAPGMTPNSSPVSWPMRECCGRKPKACNAKVRIGSATSLDAATSSRQAFSKGRPMQADVLERCAVLRAARLFLFQVEQLEHLEHRKLFRLEKCPSFHVFHLFHHDIDARETARVRRGTAGRNIRPMRSTWPSARPSRLCLAGCRQPTPTHGRPSKCESRGMYPRPNGSGPWMMPAGSSTNGQRLALDFGWRSDDIFGRTGLAWFCAGERVRALGPDNAITKSGRIFTRSSISAGPTKRGT